MTSQPKLAFVHDWLITHGGAEQVLRSLRAVWPHAPIYTLLYDPGGPCGEWTADAQIYPSGLQKIPTAVRRHRLFLPLMPFAIEQFDLSAYDLILSSSYAVAKGVLTHPGQRHIAYVHAPMRYAWDLYHLYLRQSGLDRRILGLPARLILHYLRLWDRLSADRADVLIANSQHTAERIRTFYRRTAEVIYPPVDVNFFTPTGEHPGDYYVTVSRLVPYKRLDLVLAAFARLPERRLVIIGDGPERPRLQRLAARNVEFLGYQPREVLRDHLRRARAFIFAAWEDFGITPVEAQACGTPVIAYGRGGVLESVTPGVSGEFFYDSNPEALVQAIRRFESSALPYPIEVIRAGAERFSEPRFHDQIRRVMEQEWQLIRSPQ